MTKYRSERAFSDVDDRLAAFCAAFIDLRKAFDSKVSLSTALVLSQVTGTIDAISACPCS